MESRGGGGPIDPPPPRLRVTIFSRRLLGLKFILIFCEIIDTRDSFAGLRISEKQSTVYCVAPILLTCL